jgi:TatD DNase family protein
MKNDVYFESHAHYDHKLFKGTGPELVKELKESGIDRIVIPAITYESNFEVREKFVEEEFPYVYFATGIHPKIASYLKEDNVDWEPLERLMEDKRTVAVKTGLDFSDDHLGDAHHSNQKAILHHLLRIGAEHRLPVVLHIRDAAKEILEELKCKEFSGNIEVHCFMYGPQVMNDFLESGIKYFGIGGAVTKPENCELREAVRQMPVENILLETDSPFQRPQGYAERLNTSRSLEQVASEIALLKGMDADAIREQSYQNACRFFDLNSPEE